VVKLLDQTMGSLVRSLASHWRLYSGKLDKLLQIYTADDSISSRFRAEQIAAVIRLTPLSVFANLLNASLIVITFWHSPQSLLLIIWGCLLGGLILLGARPWLALKRGQWREHASRRALRRANYHAAALGLLWAAGAWIASGNPDHHPTLMVSIITIGMLCAGSFALSTIPKAAIIYTLILGIGCELTILRNPSLQRWDLALLVLIYCLVVTAAVITSARTFGARLMAEANAARQQQLVSLLLHDFETHASDWLWELDGLGHLHNPSSRLAHLWGKSLDTLGRQGFIDLFEPDPEDDTGEGQMALELLRERLRQGQPFRNLVVPLVAKGSRRWWQLTAKPLFDDKGKACGWRGVGSDITERRNANREMNQLANFDALTGLANRHQFNAQLQQLAASLRAQDKSFALMFLDLDNFKTVNDSLGHAVGDKVLQNVGKRLQQAIRHGDMLARLGGDEFALISRGEDSVQNAAVIAQRLLACFHEPCQVDGLNLQIGCSIGIVLSPIHSDEPDTLLKNADMALYAAKSAGRNTFYFYETDMAVSAQKRLNALNDMRRVLESVPCIKQLAMGVAQGFRWDSQLQLPEFEVFFQPQIKLETGDITGFEALVRWHHPDHGLVPPSDFIPIAEESNMIIPLGIWVLMESCKLAAGWPEPWRLAVNISASQFSHGSLILVVKRALELSGLEPTRLELEITESLLIQDAQSTRVALNELRRLGVRVALDDFGTGYSSLAYLRNFPLNQLKIDRSFVAALQDDPSARAIVTAIIQLANALNLETTAEGIESPVEAAILRECGCLLGQGFLFAAPMPENALREFAAARQLDL
jgi:diguanylate cyclase (GGDEF)-like protein/PAS domain S-box-containing protein